MKKYNLGQIWFWLLRPHNDLRPISWIIGMFIMLAIVAILFFGPPIYLEHYSGGLPQNILTGILFAGFMIGMAALIRFGWLILDTVDLVFDICYLIKRHRSH
jgi:hypothetical protein